MSQQSKASTTTKGQNIPGTPEGQKARFSGAINAAIEDGNKSQILPNPCGTTEIGKINISIHNFMTAIKGIKKYGELYVNGTLNSLSNLTSLIRETGTIIAAVMKTLMNRLRDFLIDKIHKGIQDLINQLLPELAKSIKNTIVQVVVDNIFCKFKDIAMNLFNLAIDFLKEIIEKIVNVPFCAAQQFTNAFVNNIAALIDNAVGPILDQINDVLGGVGKIVGNVFQALDFILGLESFLCAAPNCPEITEFKASPWAGPGKSEVDSFNAFLAPLNTSSSDLIADATKFIDGIEIFKGGGTLGDSAGASGQSFGAACSELSQASRCGPPKVEIFGGGGFGALGEIVLDNIGRTIGVNLLSGGSGYISPPFVSFVDSCENTFTSGYATINDRGEVDEIVMRTRPLSNIDTDKNEFDEPFEGNLDPLSKDYVICLCGFRVLDTGVGYTVNDSIELSLNVPNLNASVKMTETGQIIAIDIVDKICGLTGYPEVQINSETGLGARIEPILCFTSISEFDDNSRAGSGVDSGADSSTDSEIIVNVDSVINAELASNDLEGVITTLRGRRIITESQSFRRTDVIRIVDCIT